MLSDAANRIFRGLDREIWIITAAHDGRRGGLVATTLTSASIVPEMPRVLVAIARQHATWELIECSQAFAAHLIARDRIDLVERFGMQSGRNVDKFDGLSVSAGVSGAPLLDDAAGWLECRVEAGWDSGDRSVYLAEIAAARAPGEETPILTMQSLLAQAPDALKLEMQRQRDADARLDAARIAGWREQRHSRTDTVDLG